MRGKVAPPLESFQRAAISSDTALKIAGYKGGGEAKRQTRLRLAEHATGRSFVLSYKMLSDEELAKVEAFCDDIDAVKAFVVENEMRYWRERAREVLHGYQVHIKAQHLAPLQEDIAKVLREVAND